jgi:DNA (cytosine-5)-methyltransferase 1
MKAISLFSGMGGDSLGMVNAGLELVAYSEKEKVFRETHDLNFKECVALGQKVNGDITKIPDSEFEAYTNQVDIIFAGFPCFVKGTQVLTDIGYQSIEDVTLNMKLVTHNGRYKPIVNLQQKQYTGVMYEVTYADHNTVVCTEEHPFYVRTYNGKFDFSKPIWKAAKDLTMNDFCGMVTNSTINVPVLPSKKGICLRDKKIFAETANNSCLHDKTIISKEVHDLCLHDKRVIAEGNTFYVENEYIWYAPISFVTRQVVDEDVYNFEVKDDNSYIVENIIVHNCQGFSQAGKKNANDVRNTLFSQFLRATRIVNPKYIIGENVKGLLTREMDDGRKYIDVIVSEFENLGYKIKYKLFKTDKYGIPQKRERLVIIGSRTGVELKFPDEIPGTPNLMNIVKFDMTGSIKIEPEDFDMSTIPAQCIVTDMENEEDENNPHPYLRLKAKRRNETYGDKTYANMLSFGKRDSPIHCEIIDIRGPSKTIICTYEHQPRLFVPLRNKKGYFLRCLLPDELKQIQGFPADYKMAGNLKQKIVQIGNSVPPGLIKLVAESLMKE